MFHKLALRGIEGHGRSLRYFPYMKPNGKVGWELVAYHPYPNGRAGRPFTKEALLATQS